MNINQRNVPWIGAFIESLFNALPFISIILSAFNFIQLSIVLYANIEPYIKQSAPNMTIITFLGVLSAVLFVIFVIVMVIIYKYVTPSLWTFRNKQMNKYDSEVMKELSEIRKELAEMRKQNAK